MPGMRDHGPLMARTVSVICLAAAFAAVIGSAAHVFDPRNETGSPPPVELAVSSAYVMAFLIRPAVRLLALALASALLVASMGWDFVAYYSQMLASGIGMAMATRFASPNIYFAMLLFALFALNGVLNVAAFARSEKAR